MTRLERALQLLEVERPCYMLVDADTGKDVREAKNFEVEHARHTATFSGIAMLGPHRVTLRKLTGVPGE